jgi:hypothetical protein
LDEGKYERTKNRKNDDGKCEALAQGTDASRNDTLVEASEQVVGRDEVSATVSDR